MKRMSIVTVGTSVLGISDRAEREGQPKIGQQAREAFNTQLGDFQVGSAFEEAQRTLVRSYLHDHASDLLWLPAEFGTLRLDTVQAATASDLRSPVVKDDRVFLLASDTRKGVYSARILQTMLAAEPGVQVDVHVLSGVDVSLEDEFERSAARSLARTLADAWTWARDQEATLSFHLSGGYKATMPLLLYLAGHLPSHRNPKAHPHGQRVKAEALIKHEHGHNPIRLPFLLAGVSEALRMDLDAVTHQTVMDGSWEGYAYERTPDGWRRTLLGEVIRQLAEIR